MLLIFRGQFDLARSHAWWMELALQDQWKGVTRANSALYGMLVSSTKHTWCVWGDCVVISYDSKSCTEFGTEMVIPYHNVKTVFLQINHDST